MYSGDSSGERLNFPSTNEQPAPLKHKAQAPPTPIDEDPVDDDPVDDDPVDGEGSFQPIPEVTVEAAAAASVDVHQQEKSTPTIRKPAGILKKEANVLSEILNFLNDANNPFNSETESNGGGGGFRPEGAAAGDNLHINKLHGMTTAELTEEVFFFFLFK